MIFNSIITKIQNLNYMYFKYLYFVILSDFILHIQLLILEMIDDEFRIFRIEIIFLIFILKFLFEYDISLSIALSNPIYRI